MIEIKDFTIEKSGVYFLLNDDELIYIGETKNLKKRLYSHKNGETFCNIFIEYPKIFNRVWFEEIHSEKERKIKEKKLIQQYQPKYNGYKKETDIERKIKKLVKRDPFFTYEKYLQEIEKEKERQREREINFKGWRIADYIMDMKSEFQKMKDFGM